MTNFKIGSNDLFLNKIAEYSKPKRGVLGAESELKAYRSQFQDMVHHIKTLTDSPYQLNKIEQLKQDITNNQYKIDYDELIEQLLVEEI